MKLLTLFALLAIAVSANANSVNDHFKVLVSKDKLIQGVIRGVETKYKVKCMAPDITEVKDESFKASVVCSNKNEFAVFISIEGFDTNNFLLINNVAFEFAG